MPIPRRLVYHGTQDLRSRFRPLRDPLYITTNRGGALTYAMGAYDDSAESMLPGRVLAFETRTPLRGYTFFNEDDGRGWTDMDVLDWARKARTPGIRFVHPGDVSEDYLSLLPAYAGRELRQVGEWRPDPRDLKKFRGRKDDPDDSVYPDEIYDYFRRRLMRERFRKGGLACLG